jgi:endonuclease YncB( thermonuclease family)
MSAPFDTLHLARGFEAAGFSLEQASKMAEAIAEATASADLATKADIALVRTDLVPLASKTDLAAAKVDLVKWFAGVMLVAVGLMLTGVGTATTVILNRLSAAPVSAPTPRAAALVLAADTAGFTTSALAGSARVVDGDTIEIAGTRIRLWGIDAPEHDQTCQGKNGDVYECGREGAAVMRELTGGQQVECTPRDHDRYGRTVAVCHTESGELNAAMVRRGWAVDYTKYSRGCYRAEQEQARNEQLGIWAGRFDMPESCLCMG